MDVQAHNPSHPTGLYAALPSPTWFRVLELLPGHGEEALALRLHAVDGAEPPYYEAVSYAWGDPNDVVPVECNGQRLFVTTSLHVALLHFRDRNEPRMLWADAVWYVLLRPCPKNYHEAVVGGWSQTPSPPP